MRHLKAIVAAWLVLLAPALAAAPPTAEEKARAQKDQAILDSLQPVFGDVSIDQAKAVLHLGKRYYFLPADQAKRVLTEGWGNPPDSVANVIGMIFASGTHFATEGWGAVITYEASGYVSDEDASTADYAALAKAAQDEEAERNKALVQQGFPTSHLVGWAQPPTYDQTAHTLIWARDIKFAGEPSDTLNYDLRKLGRNGVLSVNIVAAMPKLPEVRQAAAALGKTAEFESGSRYADYVPDIDKKAEYGLAGLVAAGVGVAAVKKLGLLALVAVFAKKFFILLLALLAGMGGWVRRLFRKKDEG